MVPGAFKITFIDDSEGSEVDRYQLMKKSLKLEKG